MSRGVRQGCSLSPLVYVLYAEVLACTIRSNPSITGLVIPGMAPLPVVSQYADDTSLIVTSDSSIEAVFESYSLFEKGSGSKLNLSKSKGLWLGSWSGRAEPLLLSYGPLLSLKFSVPSLGPVTWRKITGVRG